VHRPSRGSFWLRLTLSVGAAVCTGLDASDPLDHLDPDAPWLGPRSACAMPRSPASLEEASATLSGARNEKVRVQAALVLGRLGDPRAVPALIRALRDRSPLVRAVAAEVLGHLGAESARTALEAATRDESPYVRRHAAQALRQVDRGVRSEPRTHPPAEPESLPRPRSPILEIHQMGDRTHRASPALRERMRRAVTAELAAVPPQPHQDRFMVDGAIRAIEITQRSLDVEVKCDVQLILSTWPGHSILLMSSGEATVQRPRARFRSGMLAEMQNDAVQHAVRGAAEALLHHLGARAATTPVGTSETAARGGGPGAGSGDGH
jgi:hypothetical protein